MPLESLRNQVQKFAHNVCKWSSFRGYRHFLWASNHVKQAQINCFSKVMKQVHNTAIAHKLELHHSMSIEEFRQKVPITGYSYWEQYIANQRSSGKPLLSNSPCDRYQPTSGSTSAIKWIPYTSLFLSELDHAISPWMWDLYNRYPSLGNGRHYWSLSWIPSQLRDSVKDNVNDDLKLLPLWKRIFMSLIMAVPDAVSQTKTSDESWFKTLCYLASDSSLSMISVWSPTFALSILEGIRDQRTEIALTLQTGTWPSRFSQSAQLTCPRKPQTAILLSHWNGNINPDFIASLWPQLKLISAWDTCASAPWAKQLQQQAPFATFQGKGLWATEGVVTFPFQGKFPLAINSHFYEFIDNEDSKVYWPWELKIGQKVRPILTTGGGLLRYEMKDLIEVVDFLNECPCFTFLGRVDGTDLVGEKLSTELALDLLAQFELEFIAHKIKPLSLIAVPATTERTKPYYVLLCKSQNDEIIMDESMFDFVEKSLSTHFHYQLARELNQLDKPSLAICPNAWELYQQRSERRGMVVGNLKVEPLVIWDEHIPIEFQHSSHH